MRDTLKNGRKLAVQMKLDRKKHIRDMEHSFKDFLSGATIAALIIAADYCGHQGIVCQ